MKLGRRLFSSLRRIIIPSIVARARLITPPRTLPTIMGTREVELGNAPATTGTVGLASVLVGDVLGNIIVVPGSVGGGRDDVGGAMVALSDVDPELSSVEDGEGGGGGVVVVVEMRVVDESVCGVVLLALLVLLAELEVSEFPASPASAARTLKLWLIVITWSV